MPKRELWTLIGALAVIATIAAILVGRETMAEELAPRAPVNQEAIAVPVEAPVAPSAATVADGVFTGRGSTHATEGMTPPRASSDGDSAPSTGIVRGDIQIAVAVLDRIQSISVHVEEARNPIGPDGKFTPVKKFSVPATMGRGTPTFEITGVPFSEYPYVVSAYAAGLNGTRRTITIDHNTPVVDDVVLQISGGAPFTVLLRDQDQAPYVNVDVLMQPVGDPVGRPKKNGTSDNFGSVVFEDVLAGDYLVHVTEAGQPLLEPEKINVQPGTRATTTRVQTQGHTVSIARGLSLPVRVADTSGYGLADVTVSATATDRVKLTVVSPEQTTDYGGNIVLRHLTPGTWQIDVHKADFQRCTRTVTIKANEPPAPLDLQLVRLR